MLSLEKSYSERLIILSSIRLILPISLPFHHQIKLASECQTTLIPIPNVFLSLPILPSTMRFSTAVLALVLQATLQLVSAQSNCTGVEYNNACCPGFLIGKSGKGFVGLTCCEGDKPGFDFTGDKTTCTSGVAVPMTKVASIQTTGSASTTLASVTTTASINGTTAISTGFTNTTLAKTTTSAPSTTTFSSSTSTAAGTVSSTSTHPAAAGFTSAPWKAALVLAGGLAVAML
jgi:hypothetical protein